MIIEDEGDKQKLKKTKKQEDWLCLENNDWIKQFIHLLKIRILKILRYSRMFQRLYLRSFIKIILKFYIKVSCWNNYYDNFDYFVVSF